MKALARRNDDEQLAAMTITDENGGGEKEKPKV